MLALEALAYALEAPKEPQVGSASRAAPATGVAVPLQAQHGSSSAGLESSSNGPSEIMEPDLAQPKVKQEPPIEDSGAGQPHQATNGVSDSAHAEQDHSQVHEPGSSSGAEQAVAVKQEFSSPMVESIGADPHLQSAAQQREGAQESPGTAAGLPGTANSLAAETSVVEQQEDHRELLGAVAEVVAAPEQAVQVAPLTADEAAERCELLCALCTKSPFLLRLLLEVFGKVQRRSWGAICHHIS